MTDGPHDRTAASDSESTVRFPTPPSLAAIASRFEVRGTLGQGGMGVVYEALDRHTGDLVALKVLHPSIAVDRAVIERFRKELVVTRRITHKNVCRVHDLIDAGSTAVISMELV